MSVESAALVRLSADDPEVRALLRDIRAADTRARKALPGERTDVLRFESLSAQLERLAIVAMAREPSRALPIGVSRLAGFGFTDRANLHEAPPDRRAAVSPWIASGDVAVEVRLPFCIGRYSPTTFGAIAKPETAWQADPETPPKKAIARRFGEQIEATLSLADPPSYIEPSGVSNGVLTNTLRRYVRRSGPPVQAPVRYQDGSIAMPFPLQSLVLGYRVGHFSRELRLALLSIRHTEMDVEVDGCWLRNFDISRPRPAADTDRLAYELSIVQLAQLTRNGALLIRLYQTGLQPAVVGFYRALVHHLLAAPTSVGVIPMFYRHAPKNLEEPHGVTRKEAYYSEGKPWVA